jgi:hypothetical protein
MISGAGMAFLLLHAVETWLIIGWERGESKGKLLRVES